MKIAILIFCLFCLFFSVPAQVGNTGLAIRRVSAVPGSCSATGRTPFVWDYTTFTLYSCVSGTYTEVGAPSSGLIAGGTANKVPYFVDDKTLGNMDFAYGTSYPPTAFGYTRLSSIERWIGDTGTYLSYYNDGNYPYISAIAWAPTTSNGNAQFMAYADNSIQVAGLLPNGVNSLARIAADNINLVNEGWSLNNFAMQMSGLNGSSQRWRVGDWNSTPTNYIDLNMATNTIVVASTSGTTVSGPFGITDSWTPSAATDACTAGRIGWDANYIYICVASGNIKRAAIASW